MLLPDDDELYEVDQTYLGPPGRYIAVMRHRSILAFMLIAPVLIVTTHKMGLGFSLLNTGLLLLVSLRASQWVADHTTAERSARDVASSIWGDLTATRPTKANHHAVTTERFWARRPSR